MWQRISCIVIADFFKLENSVWLLNCWKCFVSYVKFLVTLSYPWNPYIDTYLVGLGEAYRFCGGKFLLKKSFLFKEKRVWTVTECMYNQENPMYYFEDFCHVFMIASILLLISEFSIHLAGTFLCREKIEPIFILIGD